MRLNPSVTLARADQALTAAETAWTNAGGGGDFYRDYHDAVDTTYEPLREVSLSRTWPRTCDQPPTGTF